MILKKIVDCFIVIFPTTLLLANKIYKETKKKIVNNDSNH